MSDTVRGLTVEISADPKKFNSGMNELRKEAKYSQQELNALQKSLEIEFDADTFAKAQQVAQRAIDETSRNADKLRERLEYLESIGATNTDEYKKLTTELAQTETKGKDLQRQLEKINSLDTTAAQKEVKSLTESLEGAKGAAAALAATAGAALAAIGKLGLDAVAAADDIATLADKHNTTTDAIQRMQYVAMQTDVTDTSLYKGLVKIQAAAADLATGVENVASKALQQLKLDFNSFDGTEEQFYAIVAALGDMENRAEAVALANDIFGDKLASELIPLINAGSGAINEYTAEFESLGAMTAEQIATLAEFDNVLNKIKTQLGNAANQIGAAFLPVLQRLADIISAVIVPALQSFAEWLNGLSTAQLTAIVAILGIVAALGTLILVLPKLISGIKALKLSMASLGNALQKLAANPIIAIIGVIAIILLLLYNTNENFRESINRLIGTLTESLQPILDLLTNTLSALIEAISPILQIVGDLVALVVNLVLDALAPLFDIINLLVGIITDMLQGALGAIIGLVGTLLNAIMPLVDILGSALTMALNMVLMQLAPVFAMLELIFSLISPLIELALIPLQLQLQMLAIPLQFLGDLLNWLAPIFGFFANFVKGVFDKVLGFINTILGGIESAINWVIDKINGLIRGINNLGGWLGIHINEIQKVSLKVSMGATDGGGSDSWDSGKAPQQPDTGTVGGGSVWDGYDTSGGSGDTYNYDNSNKTQNVTVVIQNYAKEVDVDDLMLKINTKLAEAL